MAFGRSQHGGAVGNHSLFSQRMGETDHGVAGIQHVIHHDDVATTEGSEVPRQLVSRGGLQLVENTSRLCLPRTQWKRETVNYLTPKLPCQPSRECERYGVFSRCGRHDKIDVVVSTKSLIRLATIPLANERFYILLRIVVVAQLFLAPAHRPHFPAGAECPARCDRFRRATRSHASGAVRLSSHSRFAAGKLRVSHLVFGRSRDDRIRC